MLLLLACEVSKDCETGQYCAAHPDTSPEADGDADADADADYDTALSAIYYVGDAQTNNGEFVTGHFGLEAEPLDGGDVMCGVLSTWREQGGPSSPCAQCDWAFELTLADGTAEGDRCDELGLSEDMWDGFTGSWGFASTYVYEPEYYDYPFYNAVMYFSQSDGFWFPLAYSYNGYATTVGDAESVSFRRIYDYAYYVP